MGVVSCADNSRRRRRRRPEESKRAGNLLCESGRLAEGSAITEERGGRKSAACTRRGISYKLGGAFPFVEETFLLLRRLYLSGSYFVRNLITRLRAFSYYHSTEFRVTVSSSLLANINGLYTVFRCLHLHTINPIICSCNINILLSRACEICQFKILK